LPGLGGVLGVLKARGHATAASGGFLRCWVGAGWSRQAGAAVEQVDVGGGAGEEELPSTEITSSRPSRQDRSTTSSGMNAVDGLPALPWWEWS
jgi:hypothetical protein